jgi:hypothetical protein
MLNILSFQRSQKLLKRVEEGTSLRFPTQESYNLSMYVRACVALI